MFQSTVSFYTNKFQLQRMQLDKNIVRQLRQMRKVNLELQMP